VIEFREPPQTGFELRWSMFGVRFRVLPSFFIVSAIIGAFFIWQVVGNNPVALAIGIAIDVACIFFAFVFTEFVQGLVYRSYGLRSTVVLRELGGGIYPEHEPPTALQRIVVALAAPASSFLLFAIIHYSNEEYQWSKVHQLVGFAYLILWIISLFWGIIGLLPIFPYPGGRVLLEVMNFVTPRNGLVLTLGISVVLGVAYVVYTFAVVYMRQPEIPLVRGVTLPASVLLAIFIALATMQNWQLLQYARAQRRGYREPVDDYGDRDPWDRR
jgi:stage IV sporulation protein FB